MRSHQVTLLSVQESFEQMELEFFCKPDTDLEWFAYWKDFCVNWLKDLGLKDEELRIRDHDKEELSFYSKATSDIEFLFPLDGENYGVLLTVQIMTLTVIRKYPDRILLILMMQRRKSISLMLSSHH